jgi:DNA repair protein RadC
VYVKELRVVYRLKRVPDHAIPSHTLSTPKEAAKVFVSLLGPEAIEVSGVLCLSTRHHVLAYHELSRGTLDSTSMHPREIFKAALLANATALVLGHNHPSGIVTPSADDITLTSRLVDAGQLMGIPVLDHVIVSAEGTYFSFKEAGRLN